MWSICGLTGDWASHWHWHWHWHTTLPLLGQLSQRDTLFLYPYSISVYELFSILWICIIASRSISILIYPDSLSVYDHFSILCIYIIASRSMSILIYPDSLSVYDHFFDRLSLVCEKGSSVGCVLPLFCVMSPGRGVWLTHKCCELHPHL